MKLKERLVYYLFIVVCLVICLGLSYQIVEASMANWLLGGTRTVVIINEPPKTLDSEIDRLSLKYEISSAIVRAVSKCESSMYGSAINHNRLPDGTIWSSDFGPLQVNDYYHEAVMTSLGLDIHNQYDSLEYGIMMMKEQGLSPWSASRKCWQSKIDLL
jgi:hypothetical protein